MICMEPGCVRKLHAKQLCELHYRRLKKTGVTGLIIKSPEDRFWDKVRKTEGCWLWTGNSVNGYGRLRIGHSMVMAHRYSYVLAGKDIPKGLDIDHLCGAPACVRPDHLEAVTHRENIVRGKRVTAKKSDLPVGVYKRRDRFGASIMIKGKSHYLGLFDTPQEAHRAYRISCLTTSL